MASPSLPTTGYSGLQIALHWLVAVLILGAWLFSDGMHRLLDQKMAGTYAGLPLHVLLGLLVLVFALIRLFVRASSQVPGPVPGSSEAEAKARTWGHRALYVLMIAVPLGGIAVWFGGIETAEDLHPLAGNLLLILAAGHAALACWHQWGRKDGTLMRMVRPRDG